MTDASSRATADAGCAKRTPWQAVIARLMADGGVRRETGRAYGHHARHVFDRYLPEAGADPSRPPLIFVYGGAWKTGERACYYFVGTALAKRGFEVLIPDYRLYPDVRYPDFIEDVALAYGHISLGRAPGQPPPILIGHSAGAHISALISFDNTYLAALDPRLPKPSALVGISGPYGFDPTTWDSTQEIFATIAHDPDKVRPVAQVPRRSVPSLLIHGGRDSIVTANASELLRDAIVEKGGDVEHKVYRWLGHVLPVLAMAWPLRWLAPVLDDIVAFIDELPNGPARPDGKMNPAMAHPIRTARTVSSA